MHGELSASDDDRIVVEREIAGAPVRVYRALIDPKQLDAWWQELGAPVHWEMDIRPGARWRATVADARDGARTIHGEVLGAEPPRSLTCAWTESSEKRPALVRAVVRYDVLPTVAGAVVRVTLSEVSDPRAREQYRVEWLHAVVALERFIAGTAPSSL